MIKYRQTNRDREKENEELKISHTHTHFSPSFNRTAKAQKTKGKKIK